MGWVVMRIWPLRRPVFFFIFSVSFINLTYITRLLTDLLYHAHTYITYSCSCYINIISSHSYHPLILILIILILMILINIIITSHAICSIAGFILTIKR